VEPTISDALAMLSVLTALGMQATVAETFQRAKDALLVPRALLITEVRLGEFNGLHLVLRARATHSTMRAIVTSTVDDAILMADAEALGATFVLKPTGKGEWAAAIARTLLRHPNSPVPVRAPFERRASERRRGDTAAFQDERRLRDRRMDLRIRLNSGGERLF
jgi:DNA-binding response OmpR family regulator